ncbi:molybdopterin-dependent oxidoreductase [Myxococcota bacterium]|nr:molybdopterin-dependent oxidoreductase [Myxococcota bacterium]
MPPDSSDPPPRATAGPTTRRSFVLGALSAGGALALGGSLAQGSPSTDSQDANTLPGGLDPALFTLHSRVPLTLETLRSSFGMGVVTPVSRFFVRNNLPMPSEQIVAEPDTWSLEVEGVRSPGRLTVAELKTLGVATISTVIQCSGNGRAFFEHGPSGSPWQVGASGCAIWTGLPVRQLIDALGGPIAKGQFLTGTGGENLPKGIDPLDLMVERSIPLEKGLMDCLLAWEMNGEPLPLTHGGPLRLIVPGYYGCNQIKYIRKLACTEQESPAKIQQTGYRMRPVGQKASPTQPSLWRMPVSSWLQGPNGEDEPLAPGRVIFHGVAFSGERRIARIEFSQDDGQSWSEADWIGPEIGSGSWQQFTVSLELPAGRHRLVTRATDSEGDTQPAKRVENERGYGNTAWTDLALSVVVGRTRRRSQKPVAAAEVPESTSSPLAAQPLDLSPQAEAGQTVFLNAEPSCGACHSLVATGSQGTLGPNLDQLQPDQERVIRALNQGVGVMPSYQGRLSANQIRDLARFIVEATSPKP